MDSVNEVPNTSFARLNLIPILDVIHAYSSKHINIILQTYRSPTQYVFINDTFRCTVAHIRYASKFFRSEILKLWTAQFHLWYWITIYQDPLLNECNLSSQWAELKHIRRCTSIIFLNCAFARFNLPFLQYFWGRFTLLGLYKSIYMCSLFWRNLPKATVWLLAPSVTSLYPRLNLITCSNRPL